MLASVVELAADDLLVLEDIALRLDPSISRELAAEGGVR
ncbi:unannotated protein [freshwater metagenome]|uniref:Unannotated protein n=1 Tax=freshwater metagenome TaxID=449393 RepID=A0A6J7HTS8_9ZZZZ